MRTFRRALSWAATEIGGSSAIFVSAPGALPALSPGGFGFTSRGGGGGVFLATAGRASPAPPLPLTVIFGRFVARRGMSRPPTPVSLPCAITTLSATGGGLVASIPTRGIALGEKGRVVLAASWSYSVFFFWRSSLSPFN